MAWLASFLPSSWRLIGIGSAAAALAGWIGYSEIVKANRAAEIAALQGEARLKDAANLLLVNTAEANRMMAQRVQRDADRAMASVAAELAAERARQSVTAQLRQEVARVTAADPSSCPVPASIRVVLDALRLSRPGPGAAGGDQAGAGSAAPAGRAAGVPLRTANP